VSCLFYFLLLGGFFRRKIKSEFFGGFYCFFLKPWWFFWVGFFNNNPDENTSWLLNSRHAPQTMTCLLRNKSVDIKHCEATRNQTFLQRRQWLLACSTFETYVSWSDRTCACGGKAQNTASAYWLLYLRGTTCSEATNTPDMCSILTSDRGEKK